MENTHRAAESVQVVVRYRDGRVLKGTTGNFSPGRATFLVQPATAGEPLAVALRDLKAVFFVRDLDGDASRNDRQDFQNRPVGLGVAVTFSDGEVLIGASWTYDPVKDGFFVFPADPESNNLRVYVVMRAVASVARLRPATLEQAG
jgi:uncharacterized protein DUF6982